MIILEVRFSASSGFVVAVCELLFCLMTFLNYFYGHYILYCVWSLKSLNDLEPKKKKRTKLENLDLYSWAAHVCLGVTLMTCQVIDNLALAFIPRLHGA